MKYYKVIFNITNLNGNILHDMILLQTTKDVLCAITVKAGFESFEEFGNNINGYVQQQAFNENVLTELLSKFPVDDVKINYTIIEAEDKDWNQLWEEKGFEPIVIKDKCIIHDINHPIPESENGKEILDITIDAKQAFGTGTHETTKMIVEQLLITDLTDKTILDCGCGTGILSIIAAKKNAKSVVSYDIDEWSVRNTKHNCIINKVKNINVFEGNANIIKSLNQKFNIVLANINRNILLADMPKFRDVMDDSGQLIVSGFYTEDVSLLVKKAKELRLKLVKSTDNNDWCMLVFSPTKE